MSRRSFFWVNGITLYRLIAAPVLILLILNGEIEIFRWMLAVSFFTDAVDGFLARWLKVTSVFGARLDSIADDLTAVAAITGILIFRPGFLEDQMVIVSILLTLFLIQTILALVRYGRISGFHTYAAKVAAVLQAIFFLSLFFSPEPWYFLFYLAAFVTIADLLEEIILVMILPEWTANVKGLFWVLRKKRIHKISMMRRRLG